jgi:hypothetical protein
LRTVEVAKRFVTNDIDKVGVEASWAGAKMHRLSLGVIIG